jgi:phage head maturation protease
MSENRVRRRGRPVASENTSLAVRGLGSGFTDAGTLPIGRTLVIEDRADAAWGEWLVSDTVLGNEVLALARDAVPLGLSIGFADVPGGSRWSADRQRVTRTRATLDHVAVVRVPAYAGAGVVGLRAGGHTAPTTPTLLTLLRRRG